MKKWRKGRKGEIDLPAPAKLLNCSSRDVAKRWWWWWWSLVVEGKGQMWQWQSIDVGAAAAADGADGADGEWMASEQLNSWWCWWCWWLWRTNEVCYHRTTEEVGSKKCTSDWLTRWLTNSMAVFIFVCFWWSARDDTDIVVEFNVFCVPVYGVFILFGIWRLLI